MKPLRFSAISLLMLAALGSAALPQDQKAAPKKDQAPAPSVEQLLKETRPAAGFTASIFATPDQANYPVFVSAAPDGTLYVGSDQNGSLARAPHMGRIFRLRDTKASGHADEVKLFVKDVDSPRGLAWDIDRLYVLHPPHISAFIDKDGSGVASEEKILVKNCAFTFKDRPADHTSNGLTLGIDGWLYAAIGDFGFMEAEGTDGRKQQLRGGGVIRVRPDGTGLELFSYGTRNILQVALSPLLDGFARDNTNDGDGWDTRFHHFTGMENHGYPRFYQHFADEEITPLADYGGGAGCGTCWIEDPNWPAAWNNKPFTCDWGRGEIYSHPVVPKGSTFIEEGKPGVFVKMPRPTDLDIDGAGCVYVNSWRGGQFTYAGPNIGYIAKIVPKDFKPTPVPDFNKLTDEQLAALMLSTKSQKLRQESQRRLLRMKVSEGVMAKLSAAIADTKLELAARVAAIFFLQLHLGTASHTYLMECGKNDPTILPWILRALTNDERQLRDLPVEYFTTAMKSADARTRREAMIGFTRLNDVKDAAAIAPLLGDEDAVIAHTAARALAQLKAVSACLAVLESNAASPALRTGAARALAMMHEKDVVDGLIALLQRETTPERRTDLLAALCRLYHQEAPWKGESWGTRPDTRGPYYHPVPWAETPKIAAALEEALNKASAAELVFLGETMAKNRITNGDPLGKLIALAKRDATAIPVLVDRLAMAEKAPESSLELLIAASKETATAAKATASLVRIADLRAYVAALAAAEKNEDARPILLRAPFLYRFSELFLEMAVTKNSCLSWAVLLRIAVMPEIPEGDRETIKRAIDDAWGDAKRRTIILAAIRLSGDRSKARDLVALAESREPNAAEAAKLLKELKLDPARVKAIFEAKGPKMKEIKIPDAIAEVQKVKGEVWRGEQLFSSARCVICHTVAKGQPLKGPYLGNIARTYKRKDLAESILLPSKTIAQGFQTNVFEMLDGKTYTGYVTLEAADKVVIRDLNGVEFTIIKKEIEKRKKTDKSMMPEGLMAELTMLDFASILDYLEDLAAQEAAAPKPKKAEKPKK